MPPSLALAAVREAPAGAATARFRAFLQADTFPCVGARAALAQGGLRTVELGRLGDARNDARLLDAVETLARDFAGLPDDTTTLHSLAALFDGPGDTDEARFEAMLWSQLQRLHALDVRRGHRWAVGAGRDPDAPDFAFSLAGHPFFVIGLHAGASRLARRFAVPVLVFNSHRQFGRLRADGRYAKMQAATRARDTALQGSINPNLADWGTAPETRQYSGREVGAAWRCPFRPQR